MFLNNYCFYFQNIWIQWLMWHIVGPIEQIFAKINGFLNFFFFQQSGHHSCTQFLFTLFFHFWFTVQPNLSFTNVLFFFLHASQHCILKNKRRKNLWKHFVFLSWFSTRAASKNCIFVPDFSPLSLCTTRSQNSAGRTKITFILMVWCLREILQEFWAPLRAALIQNQWKYIIQGLGIE